MVWPHSLRIYSFSAISSSVESLQTHLKCLPLLAWARRHWGTPNLKGTHVWGGLVKDHVEIGSKYFLWIEHGNHNRAYYKTTCFLERYLLRATCINLRGENVIEAYIATIPWQCYLRFYRSTIHLSNRQWTTNVRRFPEGTLNTTENRLSLSGVSKNEYTNTTFTI